MHPQIVALGGDHSISLPILRALNTVYGKVSAIHIDAHIDTWSPDVFAGAKAGSKQAQYADGTPYYWAGMEGLLTKKNVHAGIRSALDSEKDMELDEKVGFTTIPASDILKREGVWGVIDKIRSVIPHDEPVYFSLDVDSLDAAFVPGTAGPASGGYTPREVIQIIIDGLEGLNIVGADIVEVLPALDQAEITSIAAAEFTIEVCFSPHRLHPRSLAEPDAGDHQVGQEQTQVVMTTPIDIGAVVVVSSISVTELGWERL